MDFSFVLIIPLAALISVVTVIVKAWSPKWREGRSFAISFWLSFVASTLILQPWHGMALREFGFVLLGFGLIFAWVVIGCLMGTAIALLVVRAAKAITGR